MGAERDPSAQCAVCLAAVFRARLARPQSPGRPIERSRDQC